MRQCDVYVKVETHKAYKSCDTVDRDYTLLRRRHRVVDVIHRAKVDYFRIVRPET